MSSRFERTATETVFEGGFFSVRRDTFRHEDGKDAEREIVEHPGAVGIVVLDGEQLWLVRQPREAVGVPDLLEIPAGRLDVQDEPPLETAKRELAEEIGKAAEHWGIPVLGAIEEGTVEGGDVCLLRPGLVAIGWSGERTTKAGAEALADLFERRGWRALLTHFDPEFLHLDTLFTMVDRNRAVACAEALEDGFLATIADLDIGVVPATCAEVHMLGPNLLSLGGGRVLSSLSNRRINGELERLGYRVGALDIGQFTRCGGGVHCLTMPLHRLPG